MPFAFACAESMCSQQHVYELSGVCLFSPFQEMEAPAALPAVAACISQSAAEDKCFCFCFSESTAACI